MKGLLLKDFYILTQSSRYYLLLICIFATCSTFSDNSAFLLFALFFIGSVISFNLISYDEKSRWSSFSGAFPYKRSELVSVKYIMTVFCILINLLINLLIHEATVLMTGSHDWNTYLGVLLILFPVGFIAPSILLPATFKFGVEKGRLVYYIIFLIVGGCIGGLTAIRTDINYSMDKFVIRPKELLISFGISLFMFAVSWMISVNIYKNKEL